MHPFLPPIANDALDTIVEGGLVLAPTANLWQVLSDYRKADTMNRHLALCPPSPVNRPELLFADLEMLQKWFPRLHPKIDNLLLYHRRPCTVLLPISKKIPDQLADNNGLVAARLILDSFCYRLSEELESPLLASMAMAEHTDLPVRFGKVRSDILRQMDHVVQRRQREDVGDGPAVTLYLNEADEIVFI